MKRASALILLALAGCSSPPGMEQIASWRNGTAPGAPILSQTPDVSDLRTVDDVLARVDALRLARDLEGSRWVCMAQLKQTPNDTRLLWRAARAESDMVVVLKARGHERESRDVAAASGVEYARRADKGSLEPDAPLLGQLAWSLGSTVHLQPMFDRDDQAAETKAAADRALGLDPDQITALATLSVLHMRLATLPWIADLFAGDAPEGTLEEAIGFARRCVELEPSLFHHLLLAKALVEAEQPDEATAILVAGLGDRGYRPRDAEVREEVLTLLDTLREE